MESPRIYPPIPELRAYIKNFVMWDLDFTNVDPFKLMAVPMGVPVMVFPYSGCLQINAGEINGGEQIRPILFGQITRSVEIRLSGAGGLLLVIFSPAGIFHFLEHSLRGITDRYDYYLEQINWVWKDILPALRSNIPLSDMSAKARIESVFLRRLNQSHDRDESTMPIVEWIDLKKGKVSANEVSIQFSLSLRSLERRFLMHVGIGPKYYANIVRFRHILRYKKDHPDANLLDLSEIGGFVDQSHFIKNFKKITGESPEAFFSHNLDVINHTLEFT
jgi:AraC-like DNA-binding protein